MSRDIANYIGLSTVLENIDGNKGFWNLFDHFYFKSNNEWQPYNPYTGYALNNINGVNGAANGTSINASNSGSQGNVGGTSTFTTGIPFTTLRVIYGNMANGSLGNPAGGAVLSINGSAIGATGTYGTDGYSSSYQKYYDTSSGTLNSIGISAGVGGSHEAYIYAIIINGTKLNATGPTYA